MKLEFTNRAWRDLPFDPNEENRTRQVFGACFTRVRPTPVKAPRTLCVAREVAELLDFTPEFTASAEFAEVFAGNRSLPGMDPVAACYGGHQFGTWAGQLGDGRAISLGELKNARGEHWELQLKGAGPTPYSRRADGRAVLRSSLREFLCSEAMHHLGIPTTRALCLVSTGEDVLRDLLYDGNARHEPGAIVCRVAPTFLRFGNFELFAARDDRENLAKLGAHTLTTHFPELGPPSAEAFQQLLGEVSRRTAELMAAWMAKGFVHGVMNTDNMSILGLTIDYGPFGFLDDFAPNWTPNITDASGRRYRYENQPSVALWNLVRLAHALFPLIGDVSAVEAALSAYGDTLTRARSQSLAEKLGLHALREDETRADGTPGVSDATLVDDLFELLAAVETDFTLFFRRLADVKTDPAAGEPSDEVRFAPLRDAYYDPSAVSDDHRSRLLVWLRRYVARVRDDGRPDSERRRAMNAVNPKYVLRNYVAQLAIEAAERGDLSVLSELLDVLRHPFDEQPAHARFAEKRPEWARHRAGCSMLSCSS
ncbi:MAG TPA: YdiU family protein [Polyangiaceae bacterium]|nr:YdiU family protein [Polyangiaceae bacterium]